MDGRQKRQMVGLFCMMAVSAFLETGAVMMVMAVVEMVIVSIPFPSICTHSTRCGAL